MILRQLTIVSPDTSVAPLVLGVMSYDAAGHATGYTLEDVEMKPAPLKVRRQSFPTFAGGVVASGHSDIRDVSVAGTIVGPSIDVVNTKLRELVAACGDPMRDTTKLQFSPVSTLPLMELAGVVEKIDTSPAGAFGIHFTISFVAGQPFSTAGSASHATSTSGSVSLDAIGNVTVFPEIDVTTSGAVTGITVTNTTTGEAITLGGLGLTSGSHTITISTEPGYENIVIDGTSHFDKRELGSVWPTVTPGANNFTVTSVGGSIAALSVTWKDGWSV